MKRKSGLRNQYGLALWVKILLGLFGTGLLIAIAVGIIAFTFVKDAMDPKKTQETAAKICTLADPLPAPFEYGQMNVSMAGYYFALVNNTSSKALYFLIKSPRKDDSNAQKLIESVASGESALPTASGTPPTKEEGSTDVSVTQKKMKVDDKGVLDVAGDKMYYVKGKAQMTKKGADSAAGGSEVDTFFGGVDGKDGKTNTFLMIQETDPTKPLTMDEVKSFTGAIKAFP